MERGSGLWKSGIRLAYADLRLVHMTYLSEKHWLGYVNTMFNIAPQEPWHDAYHTRRNMVSALITKLAVALENDPSIFDVGYINTLIFDGLTFMNME